MHIQPTQFYCLIRLHEDKPLSGLQLPDNHSLQNPHGEVIRLGPDCKLVSVNDRVLFMPENAIQFDKDGDLPGPVYIIPESCIFAKYAEIAG